MATVAPAASSSEPEGHRSLEWGLPILVLLAQVLVSQAYTFEADFIHVVWSALLLLVASVLALASLQGRAGRAKERGYLLLAAMAALWLGWVQFGSVAPARGLYSTWVWWAALCLVPVARLAWLDGWAGRLLLALLLPGAWVALVQGWSSLQSQFGYWSVALDTNVLADRLALMTFLLLLGWTYWQRPMAERWQWLPVFAALLCAAWVAVLAVILQQGLEARAVMMALPLGLLLMALALRQPWMAGLVVLVALLYGLAWLDPDRFGFGASASMADLDRFQGASAEAAFSQRFGLWAAALKLLGVGWLTGTGLNSFAVLYPPLRSPLDRSDGTFVHNDWLQLAFEAGMPFLLLLLVVVSIFLWSFFRLWRCRFASREPSWRLRLGLVCGVGGGLILAHAVSNFPLYDPTLLNILVVLMVLCISAAERPRQAAGSGPDPGMAAGGLWKRWWASAVAVFGLLVWLPALGHGLTWALLREYPILPGGPVVTLSDQQHFAWSSRLRRLGLGHGVPAFMEAGWASQFYHGASGETRSQLAEMSVRGFSSALAAQPWQPDFTIAYVRFLASTGSIGLAVRENLLEEALQRSPLAPGLWLELARQLDAEGRWQEASARLLPRWLPFCAYMSTRDEEATKALFGMVPEALKTDTIEVRRCQGILDHPLQQRIIDRYSL